jgi:hypothetical protein
MKLKITEALLGFFMMASGLLAQVAPQTTKSWSYETGNDLLSECQGGEQSGNNNLDYARCEAYVRGAVDMIGSLQGEISKRDGKSAWRLTSVCLPTGATTGQLVDVVVKFLKENPEQRADKAAGWLVIRAVIGAWGCPTK